MVNWLERNNIWINKSLIFSMQVMADTMLPSTYYVSYSADGVNWLMDRTTSYPTIVAAQSALDTFAATLG